LRRPASRTSAATRARPKRKWSQRVTETSDALDLKEGVFSERDPQKIARSLKASAEHSDPYRSAMSMLTFYINRAGAKLPQRQRRPLEAARDALRSLFGRPARPQR
jgi:UTP:GlnB (protein PII) uridylyltransferase